MASATIGTQSGNGSSQSNGKQRSSAGPSPYAQPFALSEQYKQERQSAAAANGTSDPSPQPTPFAHDLSVKLICSNCHADPPNIMEEFASGDLVCGECGLILGDRIVDTRSEWRTFANEEGDDPSRVGQADNPLMDGLTETLGTRIAFDGSAGATLQRAMNRVNGTQHQNILDAFEDIQRKCDSIHLNRQVSEIAKQLYKRVEMERILRGKKTDAIIAATIFIACKMANVPRTFVEICGLTKVSKKLIGQCYNEIQKVFGLRQPMAAAAAEGSSGGVGPTNAVDLINRFSNHLALDQPTSRCVRDVAEQVRSEGLLAGRSPITIAAACIFFATTVMGKEISAKAISNAAGVSDVTIRTSFRNLVEHKNKILTSSMLAKHKEADPANLSSSN
ncbi:cyclin-like protein [Ceraceosorus bombacis]|uniref:Transcription initiation factor IIB n=1 Tax=Ceraceosorus bombacis TaxID=401625 RepID=A0A0P1BKN5_9BASI|nr:cyclin-like protein [Ceraceosorus bombacis]